MSSVQPLSASSISGLIWEIDASASALFGATPFLPSSPPLPVAPGISGKLGRVLAKVREKTMPMVVRSLNTARITIVYRSRVSETDDPLAASYIRTTKDVFASVSGPSAESLARGLLTISDFEVVIAAADQVSPLGPEDAILLDGVEHDVVMAQAHPRVPNAVAWRYMLRRAA